MIYTRKYILCKFVKMSRYSKEEWKRRKTYLIRSLFEDLPILSPINESQEPTLSSPSDSNIYRPESPMPDLIIEKEPPKHEESEDEEFYEKLARDMRRRYKKDFLNEDIKSSTDMTTEGTDENTHEDTFDVEERSLEAEIQEEIFDEECTPEIAREDEDGSELSSTSTHSSDSEERCEQITTKTDVYTDHRSSEQLLEKTYSSEKDKSRQSKSGEIGGLSFSCKEKERSDDIEESDKEEIRPVGSKELATPSEASPESSNSKNSDEYNQVTPEIMRRRQTLLSENSPPLHELPVHDSNDIILSKSASMDIDNTALSENISTFDLEMGASISNSDSMHYTATSTPKSSKIKIRSRIKRHDNRLVPYSPSSRGSKDLTSAALQTSLSSDHEPEWKEVWSNFFIGTPTVYNLCSCKNHVCT